MPKGERTGYPTQKPLKLYERIIAASSNPGDVVLDPFAGCATTPIAAERLGRRWVGIDLWEKAHEVILYRLRQEGLATPDAEAFAGENIQLLTAGDVHYIPGSPVRTDAGEAAAPHLRAKYSRAVAKEAWQKLSRQEMRDILVAAQSDNELVVCAGCGRRCLLYTSPSPRD